MPLVNILKQAFDDSRPIENIGTLQKQEYGIKIQQTVYRNLGLKIPVLPVAVWQKLETEKIFLKCLLYDVSCNIA